MKDFSAFWRPISTDIDIFFPEPIGASLHVWQTCFSEWQAWEPVLGAALSQEEWQRAQRFRDPLLASRYVIGRGLLRQLLAKYVDTPPKEFKFVTNGYGKPALPDGLFQFNLAHSGDVALYAFVSHYHLGVDVEVVDPISISSLEARRILSDSEWSLWQHLSDEERVSVFYQTWVRKEAVLKALGVGLSIEPDTFAVGFGAHPTITALQGMPLCVNDLPMEIPIKAAIALIGTEMPDVCCYATSSGAGTDTDTS